MTSEETLHGMNHLGFESADRERARIASEVMFSPWHVVISFCIHKGVMLFLAQLIERSN